MKEALRMAGGFAMLALLFASVAVLSNRPLHRSLPEGMGVLTLSFSHGADRRAACRPATEEELAKMPPNMRRPEICPRDRPPIRIEFDIDGKRMFEAQVAPSGIAGDGPSRVHRRFVLPAGSYDVAVRMSERPQGDFDWHAERVLEIEPGANRVVDFRAAAGGFVFH
jgi:hypothetical protein